jgi:membrane protein YdbS with pleckstrin-like domain
MAYPRKLLIPGEEIVVEAHANWSILVRPVAITVLLVGGCVAAGVAWSSAPSWIDYVFAAAGAIVGLWFAAQVFAYRSRLLVITTTRVIYRWGVLRRTGREIPLDRVQDVTYHQTILERIVGAGSLLVESAGASGEEPFPDVRNPARLQSLINQLIAGDRSAFRQQASPPPPTPMSSPAVWAPQHDPDPTDGYPPVPPGPPPRADGGVPDPGLAPAASAAGPPVDFAVAEKLRDLERLHQAGVLTDEEFDAKRRQILGL